MKPVPFSGVSRAGCGDAAAPAAPAAPAAAAVVAPPPPLLPQLLRGLMTARVGDGGLASLVATEVLLDRTSSSDAFSAPPIAATAAAASVLSFPASPSDLAAEDDERAGPEALPEPDAERLLAAAPAPAAAAVAAEEEEEEALLLLLLLLLSLGEKSF